MPAIPNMTVSTDDIVVALDQEFNANFDHSLEELRQVLGIVSPEVVPAGTALYQYKVTGQLNNDGPDKGADDDLDGATYENGTSGYGYVEGDVVALSHYTLGKEPIGEAELLPYRKVTTAQAISKFGFVNAVTREDDQMLKDVRAQIVANFFKFLKRGTGRVAAGQSTKGLQATLINVEASLEALLEANHDSAGRIVHFVNRFDAADYLADKDVTTQTAFGLTYLENFLGVQNVLLTNKVEKGQVIATPAENVHLYGVDFGALAQGGLSYTVSDSCLIGSHHSATYECVSCETHVLTGAALLAEVTDYIVVAAITKS